LVANGIPRELGHTTTPEEPANLLEGNPMASTKRRYDKAEFARRGDEVYETQVPPHLNAEDEGKFAAVDIESGEYEIDEDELEACDKLSARLPGAQIWLVKVGSRYLHRFGGREERGTT
jgi:hypothetical protein